MRKLSIVLVALLLITAALPYSVLAESGQENDAAVSQQDKDKEGEPSESDSSSETDSESAQEEKNTGEKGKTSGDKQSEGENSDDDKPESGEPKKDETDSDADLAGDSKKDGTTSEPESDGQSGTKDKSQDEQTQNNDDSKNGKKDTDEHQNKKSNQNTQQSEASSFKASGKPAVTEADIQKTDVNMIGHLSSGAVIYENIAKESTIPSDEYLNAVYYIKKQAHYEGDTYYLISTKRSSEEGTVGWVKHQDMAVTYTHRSVDSQSKSFAIKGSGEAFSKIWGGDKNLVFVNLTKFEGETFNVDLTEKVGNNIWYRGELNGSTVWIHNSFVEEENEDPKEKIAIETSSTSKLGHLHSNAVIYETIGDESTSFSAEDYLNAVYYIKLQAEANGETYYLISQHASSEKGVIGWVNAADLSTHTHKGVDRESRTFIIKGSGNAYSKAWGGSKDLVFDLSNFEGQKFNVHKTETVGGNVWYRGDFNGERVFIHESYLAEVDKSNTSRLGHLQSGATIYETIGDESTSFSSDDYLNAVYYIKEQAVAGDKTYYLISQKPSRTNGVIGWVKASDMSTHSHVGVDSYSKLYYISGDGTAYSKAWGGSKDVVFKDMSKYQYEEFEVNLTEKVGNNIWYRGKLDGETVWLHESYVITTEVEKEGTSKLGHIRGSDVKIYETIGYETSAFEAGDEYTNAVYYIKMQAEANGQLYYLISERASSEKGVVGWVKAEDLSIHSHNAVDRKEKTFGFTGKGNAYSKAWGGSKDHVLDLSNYTGHVFNVHKTETVGSNVWYRGDFNGERIWVHESYVTGIETESISRLGHLYSSAKIYEKLGDQSSQLKTSDYTNAVYYIKQQAVTAGETYYKISNKPSSVNGVVGWVNASEMNTHPHVGVDKKDKIFIFTGEGEAFTKAWGGNNDLVYDDLSQFEGDVFQVHLTEKVGSNIWYRGDFKGNSIWVHQSFVEEDRIKTQYLDLSLEEAWRMQNELNPPPQTDFYSGSPAYVSSDYVEFVDSALITGDAVRLRTKPRLEDQYIQTEVNKGTAITILDEVNGDKYDGSTKWYKIKYEDETLYVHSALAKKNGEVAKTTANLNVRAEKSNSAHIYGTVSKGASIDVTQKGSDWHKISYQRWRNATKDDAMYYMNPENFIDNSLQKFQFLDLSRPTGSSAGVLNDYLAGMGSLEGQGEAFIEAGQRHGVNEVYLISHAVHETGKGDSPLAQGIKHNGKIVYNMYGVGAVDGSAIESGKKRAYEEGWFTPEAAIIGGAKFIGNQYIKGQNNAGTVQNTLYEMRWNPAAMDKYGYAAHQYATDMGWAAKQVGSMYSLYEELGLEYLNLEVPVYK